MLPTIAAIATASVAVLSSLVSAQSIKTCTPYQSEFDFTGFPPAWEKASTGTVNSAEFTALKARIDWSKVPSIPPKTAQAPTGPMVTTGYNVAADPDCWWTATGCTKSKVAGIDPDIVQCPQSSTLGYTFDDGPNCTQPFLYDFLKQNNQKVDLFYIGSNVRNWPREAKLGVDAGHHIAVHTWSHPLLTSLSNDEVLAELYYTKKIIKLVTGVTPKYFRPPQGDIDDRVRAIAKAINLTNIQWNLDSFDWMMQPAGPRSPAEIDANFQGWIDKAKNGSFANSGAISLEHEANEGTMRKAIEWYPKLKESFKYIMPVVSCQSIAHPYEETNISFQTFQEVVGGKPAGSGSTGSGAPPQTAASLVGGWVAAVAAAVGAAFL
ncbi:uncharacterized protein SPPG_02473 [Spizellomyces punctatus DAOM BR117]|uniref:NodB homology domain-containing protein n=1 Tax=Spizellomyces punctatus (strain DAOM BR117) TaxID=645134 RepID=A0A0L0HKG9_SPIPD|nr:uncharacterized protein SPPG_02473 [Spizellomyces punctatus DAOM BR117]KND01966.1 hypothetical protein SPPG_02473 [Spizellomyces punctatus DAOM BR117]|eukprot:XP_016610005.1 hypothetical protein SPPG_02473 [Spizellomyces punctatus DAOM BR117]